MSQGVPELRTSERLRNKSAKGGVNSNRNPDFLYEYEEKSSEDLRGRASSWSSRGAAVVELKKKFRKSKVNTTSDTTTSCVNNSQPRINSVFKGSLKPYEALLQEDNSTLIRSRSSGDLTTAKHPPAVNYLKHYGSDYDSSPEDNTSNSCERERGSGSVNASSCVQRIVNQQSEYKKRQILNTEGTSKVGEEVGIVSEPQIDQSTEMDDPKWQQFIAEMTAKFNVALREAIVEVKKDMTKDITDLTTHSEQVKIDIKELKSRKATGKSKEEIDDYIKVKTDLKTCRLQLTEAIGAVSRQDQIIGECKERIEVLQSKLDRKELRISGIKETKDEKCTDVVKSFFKKYLGIDVDIEDAFRVGSYKPRVLVVELSHARDKSKIFSNTKKLKDVVNKFDKPFRVFDQLSQKRLAEKNRRRHIVRTNNDKTVDKLKISFQNKRLMIEGKEYRKEICAPSVRDILMATREQRVDRAKADLTRGRTITIENQTFIGFTLAVKDLQEVNRAYAKLKGVFTDTRHIICAARIPSKSFHTHEDFCDDDEHNAGAFLLRLLTDSEIYNRAIFVVRRYDGTHIGAKRWQAMADAVTSAVNSAKPNEITNVNDHIWHIPRENGPESITGSIRGGHTRKWVNNNRGNEQWKDTSGMDATTRALMDVGAVGDNWPDNPSQSSSSTVDQNVQSDEAEYSTGQWSDVEKT